MDNLLATENTHEGVVHLEECCNSREDLYQTEAPNWSVLPDVCLALIASCLRSAERGKMGLVCQNWNRVILSTPHLWRSATMSFRGRDEDLNHVKYAKTVGRFWKKMCILCGIRLGLKAKKFQRSFTATLQVLCDEGQNKLQDLTLAELQSHRNFQNIIVGPNKTRISILRSLNKFLTFQAELERLDLSYATMTLDEGVCILQSAAKQSKNTLKYLRMYEMLDSHGVAIGLSDAFADAVGQFPCLVDLTLNYGYVTDALITSLAKCEWLTYIRIRTDAGDSIQHTIDWAVWNKIRRQRPHLRIKFSMCDILKSGDIRRLLAIDMPLESVHICGNDDNDFRPYFTTSHLTRFFRHTLKKVVIDVSPVYRTYGEGLIGLISDCKLLSHLEINGKVTYTVVQQIFDLIDENFLKKNLTPYLTFMKIEITGVGQQEREALVILADRFRPRFQDFGLEYDIVVDQNLPFFLN